MARALFILEARVLLDPLIIEQNLRHLRAVTQYQHVAKLIADWRRLVDAHGTDSPVSEHALARVDEATATLRKLTQFVEDLDKRLPAPALQLPSSPCSIPAIAAF